MRSAIRPRTEETKGEGEMRCGRRCGDSRSGTVRHSVCVGSARPTVWGLGPTPGGLGRICLRKRCPCRPLPFMGIPSAHQTLIHSRRPRGQVRLGLSSPRAQIFQQIAASGNISGTSRESSKRSCPDPTLLSSGNHIQRPTDSRRHGQELPICLRANHTLVRRPHHKPSPTSQIGG